MADTLSNIDEFNKITGLIFAQLFRVLPRVVDIDRLAIAQAMGVIGPDWSQHKLESGMSFSEVLAYTISWLAAEDYIRSAGTLPAERVTLTTKGLAAMNAMPSGLNQSVGTTITKAVEGGSYDLSAIGDLVGGIFGGFTKSITG